MLTPPSSTAVSTGGNTSVDNYVNELKLLFRQNEHIINKKTSNLNMISNRIQLISESDNEKQKLLDEVNQRLSSLLGLFERKVSNERKSNAIRSEVYNDEATYLPAVSNIEDNMYSNNRQVREDVDHLYLRNNMPPNEGGDIYASVNYLQNYLSLVSDTMDSRIQSHYDGILNSITELADVVPLNENVANNLHELVHRLEESIATDLKN